MILLKVIKFKLFDYCLNVFLNKLGENLSNLGTQNIRIGQIASRIETKTDVFTNVKIDSIDEFYIFGCKYNSITIYNNENKKHSILLDNNVKIYY